jgi:hypothetical protein
MLAELRSIDVPTSEVRLARTAPIHDTVTLSTAPLSRASRIHGETSLTGRSTRKVLELFLVALVMAALVALFVSVRSAGTTATATTESPPGSKRPEAKPLETIRPTSSIATAAARVAPVPRETRDEAVHLPESRRATARPSLVKSEAKKETLPTAPASTAPRSAKETEPGLAIPDEVLDRRE